MGAGTLGVVSETIAMSSGASPTAFEMAWNNSSIDRNPDFTEPAGYAMSQAQRESIYSGMRQMQTFFDEYVSEWHSTFPEIDVYWNDGRTTAAGAFIPHSGLGDHNIVFPVGATLVTTRCGVSSFVYTPVHEIFHFFDEETVDLVGGCATWPFPGCNSAPSLDHRFATTLKEGAAEFAIELGDPWVVTNAHVSGLAAFYCFFHHEGTTFTSCFQSRLNTFRKTGTDVQRPNAMGLAWPDCRVCAAGNCNCLKVPLVGGQPGFDDLTNEGTAPNSNNVYNMIPQLLLEIWETAVSYSTAQFGAGTGQAVNATFGRMFLLAFQRLSSEPLGLTDFRDFVKYSLSWYNPGLGEALRAIVDTAFDNHGIDATHESWCSIPSNEALCN